jgi:3-phenylpropionate/trans-cinnamate dioxygenase ferredoxin reductase subunit
VRAATPRLGNGTVVIVGAGPAGATAAFALRDEGHTGPIILVGREPAPPYERPLLSKEYLRGDTGADRLWLRPLRDFEEGGIELRVGTEVASMDLRSRTVTLLPGGTPGSGDLRFDQLLLATGSRPRRPAIDGVELDGVIFLRSLADADRLRSAVAQAEHVLVVGMGFIGAEVAASLRAAGRHVTALDRSGLPLSRAVGPDVARVLAEIHREKGVRIIEGASVASFDGRGGRLRGRVERRGVRVGRDLSLAFEQSSA